jgi:hypothetical protein
MAMNGTILKRLTLAAALLLGLSSCYQEDMSVCVDPRGNVHFALRLTEGVERRGKELADFDITGVRVWAFDSQGRSAAYTTAERNADGRYEAWMNLSGGDYNFVAWTGNGTVYKVADTSGVMDEMVLFLDHSFDEAITETIPDLLYGSVQGCAIATGRNNDIDVAMSPDTYNINVTAKGLEQNADIWEVSIYKSGTYFLFNHSIFHDEGVFHHLRKGALTGPGQFAASMRIVAPGADTPGADGNPRLVVRNATSGEVCYDRSLVKTIVDAYAKNGQTIDFEHTYTYDITLAFDASMGVTVTVNGWEHQTEPTDLE